MKIGQNERDAKRKPIQKRARHKVELILEATLQLLEKGGLEQLTTNAVAETAGVSIGALYQYFPNKVSILDALADREAAAQAERILAAIEDESITLPQDRVAAIVRAIMASYSGRARAHRLVMAHSLPRATARLSPLLVRLADLLTYPGSALAKRAQPISAANAFVLTQGFAGVLRGMLKEESEGAPQQQAIEDALVRWIASIARDQ